MKWIAKPIGGLIVASLLVSGCESAKTDETQKKEPAPVDVTTAAVKRQPIDQIVDVTGTIYGDEEATISTKIAGRLSEIYVDVGDRVPPGGRLARIDPVDDELFVRQKESAVAEALAALGLTELPGGDFDVNKVSTVERARLQAASATSKRERGEKLFTQTPPLISAQDFDDLKTAESVGQQDFEVARLQARTLLATARSKVADLEQSRQRLRDTVIYAPDEPDATRPAATQPAAAPAGGRFAVASRSVSVGEYLPLGAATFRLVADDVVKFRTAVPERFVGQVKVGQKVMLNVAGEAKAFEGKVSRISPAVESQSRTFQVEILVPNPQARLRPGSFARGTIITGQQPDVAFVPKAAVVTFAGVSKVYAIRDGKAVEMIVTTGDVADGLTPLLTGFKGGDEVAMSNFNKLANNVPVRPSGPATMPTK